MESNDDITVHKLQEFNNILNEKNLLKEISDVKSQHKLEEIAEYVSNDGHLNRVIEKVASSGDVGAYDWKLIKNFVLYKIKETILNMQQQYPDFVDRQGDTFENQLDNVIQSFLAFEDRAPFTIQRICEIISNPRKFYKSTKKLLFALEKCVNITPQSNS